MALANPGLPYGIRDIKLTPINADNSLGTAVDLPAARTLSFEETEDFEELRGDDQVYASRGNGPVVNWELEAGGLSLAAYKVIAGGTITSSGVTPNLKETYAKAVTDARPYFKIEGQAIADAGGDVHTIIYKAKATGEIGGDHADGAFFLTSASGIGIGNSTGKLYDHVNNETAVAIS